jgi:hypothetical protein
VRPILLEQLFRRHRLEVAAHVVQQQVGQGLVRCERQQVFVKPIRLCDERVSRTATLVSHEFGVERTREEPVASGQPRLGGTIRLVVAAGLSFRAHDSSLFQGLDEHGPRLDVGRLGSLELLGRPQVEQSVGGRFRAGVEAPEHVVAHADGIGAGQADGARATAKGDCTGGAKMNLGHPDLL